jgi:hypothetical protein
MLYFKINNNERIERACKLFVARYVTIGRHMFTRDLLDENEQSA